MSELESTTERFAGEVPAALPLALLEAVRAHDRPDEFLEDEDPTVSLPRRLGLTGVIGTQIQRYETAAASGRDVRFDDVVSLMRLVLRRPDAAPIFVDTGRRFAQWHFEGGINAMRTLVPRLPRRLSSSIAARAMRRSLVRVNAGARLHVTRQPLAVRIDDCVFPKIDPAGVACGFVPGLLMETLRLYTGASVELTQCACGAGAAGPCEWRESSAASASAG